MSNLPNGWIESTLNNIIDIKIDNRGRNPKKYVDSGIPVIDNYLITGERYIDFQNVKRYIDDETYNTFIRNYLQEHDVLITLVGNGYGNVSLVTDEVSVIIQNTIGIRCNKFNNSIFLFYWLKVNKKLLENMNIGAAQPSIKVGNLLNLELLIPSKLEEQKAIANILSSFDNKIELLKEQNKTLETMTQTIFKEWFVKSTNVKIVTLGEIGKVITGKTPSTKNIEYWGQDIPFVTPTDFKNYGKFTLSSNRKLSLKGKEKMKNTVLPKDAILVTCIGSDMGKITIANEESITNQQINSLVINDINMIEYTYQYLKSIYCLLRNIALGGSTMPIINKTSFENIEIPIPKQELLINFTNTINPFNEKIKNNTSQIQNLSYTRDTLLPKLMSGTLRVKGFENEN